MRDAGYRSQEEVEQWKAKDPITRLRQHLLETQAATAEELDAIDAEVQALVTGGRNVRPQQPLA